MFILNKNTNVIQECVNRDVIKVCEKDAKNYAVAATKEELMNGISQEPQEEPEKALDEEEQEKAPEGIQGGQDEDSEGDSEGESQDDWKNLNEEEKVAALEAKKVSDLRTIAKAEGIQGYANMNKDTLIAMIMNH